MQKRLTLSGKTIGGLTLGGLALGMAMLAAPASAAGTTSTTALPTFGPKPAGATFSVAPLAGVRGSTVTFTGNSCAFDGVGGTVGVLVGADGGIPVPETVAKADGTWSTSATVPASAPTGRRQVLARCVDPTGKTAWIYDEATYFVATPGQTPAVSVSATTVEQGGSITVKGTGCLVNGTPGHLDVLDLFHGAGRLGRTSAPVAADGSWSLDLAVPADAVLGSSPVGAHCLRPGSSSIEVFYIPANVTVTAAVTPPTAPAEQGPGKPRHRRPGAPTAVVVSPHFTG
jgi:hypothetical protein